MAVTPEFDDSEVFHDAAEETVQLANRFGAERPDADLWDVADGVLAGAVQYWLYSREPCGDPRCDDCAEINTAAKRLAELLKVTGELAETSEYFHSPHDINVGRA